MSKTSNSPIAPESRLPQRPDSSRKVLTKDLADKFLFNTNALGVTGLTRFVAIEDDAAVTLSKFNDENEGLWLEGFEELSVSASQALSGYHGELRFGLTELSTPVAEALSKCGGKLRFERLTEISDSVAEVWGAGYEEVSENTEIVERFVINC